MTLKTYIDTICKSEITSDGKEDVIINLFKAAGRKEDFSREAATSWYYGRRKPKVSRYFPNVEEGDRVNYEGIFHFFEGRAEGDLRILQQLFRNIGDSGSPIDVETDDMDTFRWSLVNQFCALLGLQMVSTPPNVSTGDKAIKVSQPLNRQEVEPESEAFAFGPTEEQIQELRAALHQPSQMSVLRRMIAERHLKAKLSTPPNEEQLEKLPDTVMTSAISPNSITDISQEKKHSIRSKFLPHETEDCCYYCKFWEGDRTTLGIYLEPTYARCRKYNRAEQLSSSPTCKDYERRPKLPGEW